MDETDPTSQSGTGPSESNNLSSNSPRQPRIHFPDASPGSSEKPHRPTPLASLPSRVGGSSSLRYSIDSDRQQIRRRVRSVDSGHIPSHRRVKRAPAVSLGGTAGFNFGQDDPGSTSAEDFGPGAFSDEYDLSHEDPRILQDVQRALASKARREARMKAGQSTLKRKGSQSKSDVASFSSLSGTSSPPRVPISTPTTAATMATSPTRTSIGSEIDFSPSTGLPTTTLHPVPCSSDNGATLDWTGLASDEERSDKRWSLSIPKRKGKEKMPSISSANMEKMETMHAEKINRIKTSATPHTLRKAAMTRSQLERRYKLLSSKQASGVEQLNMAKVVRWFDGLRPHMKTNLEKEEPFTWLKHLDKRRTKSTGRSPWHLSALLMEEYFHSQAALKRMETIPEDRPSTNQSPVASTSATSNTLSLATPSRTSSFSLGPSLSRKRSLEAHISFEPLVDSVDADSRKSADSVYSILSGSSRNATAGGIPSPSSSRLRIRDYAHRVLRRPNDSDDSSSMRNSISEASDDGMTRSAKTNAGHRVLDKGLTREDAPEVETAPGIKIILSRAPSLNDDVDGSSNGDAGSVEVNPSERMGRSSLEKSPTNSLSIPNTPRALDRHRVRISLPSSDPIFRGIRRSQEERDAEEEKLQHEYDLKAQLLDETTAQNHRIRQLLNRVAAGVKEYEMIQSSVMKSLGIQHTSLPPELLEAFGHDPAAVTGSTRKFRGWEAVDDIHNRLTRQRETFQTFLSHFANGGILSAPGSVLEGPISSLLKSLDTLEAQRQEIVERAKEVAEVLTETKDIHATVKADYNDTLSHTSVVYPELSHIVALEESYKDQYQQFWEFGMDALTFFLDSVTPFWRTYGKTIGEDVQDFLIIPLYRNEFTGEAKRYPITRLPKRSLRHWMALMLFFILTGAVTALQGRTALSSSTHYRLLWITNPALRWVALPFFWIGIVIQWGAVVLECCIVLAQFGVLFWWLGWSIKIFS